MADYNPNLSTSEVHYPETHANGNGVAPSANGGLPSIQNAKESVVSGETVVTFTEFNRKTSGTSMTDKTGAQSALSAVQNHPLTQNVKETVADGKPQRLVLTQSGASPDFFNIGPVAQNVKAGYANTAADFRGLADARQTPSQPAATGQPLTAYHSFFYHLLSWKNPRATLVSFLATVIAIFGIRYLNILRWVLRITYIALGTTAAAEIIGKFTISHGLTSQFRPRQYYTLPRETVDIMFDELHELLNFFVLEFQRILFAENVVHTIGAFAASFLAYWLIKIVPLWGLSLIATCVIYLGPLIYISNREAIDHHINYATNVVSKQTAQVKDLTAQHTARATESAKAYANNLSNKASQYVGPARGRSASPEVPIKQEMPTYKHSDFPTAPKQDFVPPVTDNFASSQSATHAHGDRALYAS